MRTFSPVLQKQVHLLQDLSVQVSCQQGDSDYTITVDKYEETADTSDSETIASWSDYEVEKPDTL